jgi:hypothetical protein
VFRIDRYLDTILALVPQDAGGLTGLSVEYATIL